MSVYTLVVWNSNPTLCQTRTLWKTPKHWHFGLNYFIQQSFNTKLCQSSTIILFKVSFYTHTYICVCAFVLWTICHRLDILRIPVCRIFEASKESGIYGAVPIPHSFRCINSPLQALRTLVKCFLVCYSVQARYAYFEHFCWTLLFDCYVCVLGNYF